MGNGCLGNGVLVSVGNSVDGASSTWTSLGVIRSEVKRDPGGVTVVDDSGHGSLYKRTSPGMIDMGTVTFTLYYQPTETAYTTLHSLWIGRTKRDFKITDPNTAGSEEQFVGFVTNLSRAYPIDDMMTCDVSVQIDGEATFTATPA